MTVDVSVVVPIGGVDDDLAYQLEALADQSHDGEWELVISFNSTDGAQKARLATLLRRWFATDEADRDDDRVRARIVDSSDLASASHARNVGAAAAEGRLLLFCDGDDIVDRSWMSNLIEALARWDAVGGHLDEELLQIAGQEDWRPPATPGELPSFLDHPYLVSANMGVHRATFEEVGGFDTGLIRGEDIAFSWDLLRLGRTLGYAADAVVHYRHRRGLRPMMRQHYLYGRGFSQILARKGVPGGDGAQGGVRALKPNGQAVDNLTPVYFLRRGSIATGRVVGLIEERLRQRRADGGPSRQPAGDRRS